MIVQAAHPDALGDEPPGLVVREVAAGARVRLSANVTDDAGVRWASEMDVVASADGVADLGDDPMGPLWRLAPVDSPSVDRFAASWEGFEVVVEASDGAGGHGAVTLRRRRAAPGVRREEVDTDGLVATTFVPAGDGPHPGVVMFHGSGGGVAGLEPSGALLASHGYATLVVGWFGAGDTPADIRRIPVESLARGVTSLRADERTDATRVAALGTSAGGEACMALCSTQPHLELGAVITIAGSSVAWQALVDGRPPKESRYTLSGVDLPWAPVDSTKMLTEMLVENPIRRLLHRQPEMHTLAAYESGLHSKGAASAGFAVERVDAPLLLLAGDDDEVWPSAEMAAAMAERRGTRPTDRLVVLPGTGHISLRPPDQPATVLRSGQLVFGGDSHAFADAMSTCWRELLAHLDTHLAESPS